MYRIFYYRVDDDGVGLFIEHEEEYNTLDEALKRVVFFEDDDLFEIAKDVPWFDGSCDVTQLKTVARPASMRAYLNSYYSRW